jgi:hypothetical protein
MRHLHPPRKISGYATGRIIRHQCDQPKNYFGHSWWIQMICYLNWKSEQSCKGECESMKKIDQTFSWQSSGSRHGRSPGLGHAEVSVVDKAQSVVNFTDNLQAAFAPILFQQKITKPNYKHRKAAQNKFCTKKLLVKYW